MRISGRAKFCLHRLSLLHVIVPLQFVMSCVPFLAVVSTLASVFVVCAGTFNRLGCCASVP